MPIRGTGDPGFIAPAVWTKLWPDWLELEAVLAFCVAHDMPIATVVKESVASYMDIAASMTPDAERARVAA